MTEVAKGDQPGHPAQPTVLVVDDEESFTSSLTHTLTREGYRCFAAYDGPTALALALREQPDVILLDLMLPGMHGLEVCRALRAADIRQPGVIMVTAKGSDYDAIVGLESGADDYVAKPFNLNLLLARVRALLRQKRRLSALPLPHAGRASTPELVLGDLQLAPDAYEARWRQKPLDLSPRLFELLLYFARNLGKVLTRDELLNGVWGYDYAGETRTVDVHVHWLRQVLAEAGDTRGIIQTVRGVGYKMIAYEGGDQSS